jgi:hypothetical protein
MTTDLWTTDDVAAHLGIASTGVRKELHRLGIRPVARQPGRSGQNLYDPDEVKQAASARPGKGTRTDLARETPTTEPRPVSRPRPRGRRTAPTEDHATMTTTDTERDRAEG